MVTGRHVAVNYPMSDYATYIPNVAAKLYDDTRVPDDKFDAARLENRKTALVRITSLLTSHYFDMANS